MAGLKKISRDTAEKILKDRETYRQGKWIAHSRNVALSAMIIADKLKLDSDLAYSMGLLHDIGRSFTEGQFKHIVCGYEYMKSLGYFDAAGICLSHSFAVQDIHSYVGAIDIGGEEQKKYQKLLQEKTYNDYDKLIQLCDAVATDTGFVLPEQRFVGLVFKYGFNSFTIQKWKAVLQLKKDFSERLNEDVNLLLQSYQK